MSGAAAPRLGRRAEQRVFSRARINGYRWAQHQAARAGLEFTALDNAFTAVDDANALQAICDRPNDPRIDALLRKWLAILPESVHRCRQRRRLPLRPVGVADGVLPDS
ncbi:hypothetical protein [Rhodococcus wratislaviensis]|uniref:hypothetical protein n=1 Tax=Rhodococcus wratislaviensis TaxID=44752 RepID=UPI00365CC6E5